MRLECVTNCLKKNCLSRERLNTLCRSGASLEQFSLAGSSLTHTRSLSQEHNHSKTILVSRKPTKTNHLSSLFMIRSSSDIFASLFSCWSDCLNLFVRPCLLSVFSLFRCHSYLSACLFLLLSLVIRPFSLSVRFFLCSS